MADIVVYGGGLQGCAAAAKAARNAPGKTVVLIIPDPVTKLGGIGTIGGQNFFDIRNWNKPPETPVHGGTFDYWYYSKGQFYNTDDMATQIQQDLSANSNLSYSYAADIENFQFATNPYRITAVEIRNIYRDPADGYIKWGTSTQTIAGSVFIDASEEGRLLRLFNSAAVTVGRYDWPSNLLDADEKTGNKVARQQCATLMFKMTNINTATVADMSFINDPKGHGTKGCYGGIATYQSNSTIIAFNDYNGPYGYAIKPLNGAQNGAGHSDWWINTFLIFNVDGRAHYRDRNTWRYPANKRSDYRETDVAWANAREFLKNNAALVRNVMRQFPGFADADFVYNGAYPVVGEILYVRETLHAMNDMSVTANGTENSNYELTTTECHLAGTSPTTGADTGNYASRVGLGFYQTDINAYKFEDLKNASGQYHWGVPLQNKLRPDIGITSTSPLNPVYIPYAALTTNYAANLLIPGYGARCSSMGWSEMRVLPNLCVFGDAAGVAAAYCANNNKYAYNLTSSDICAIQNTLITSAFAILNK